MITLLTEYRAFVMPCLTAILLATSSVACSGTATGHLSLTTVADVPLSGHTTRWDYASLDTSSHRLLVAHLCDSVVAVFDTQQQKVVADITDVGHVHGTMYVPQLDLVYASATETNEVIAIAPKRSRPRRAYRRVITPTAWPMPVFTFAKIEGRY